MPIGHRGAFEIAQKFGQPLGDEIGGPPLRLWLLVFVVQAGGDRMMGVVHFVHEIGDGELKLECPGARRLVRGCQAKLGAEHV